MSTLFPIPAEGGDDTTVPTSSHPKTGPIPRSARPSKVRHSALLFGRIGTSERVADILRRRITEGELNPGTRLSEQALGETLAVSRNTLREAFRLLTHEGLLVHRPHRGVFVPELGADDFVDLYRLRRTIECDVIRTIGHVSGERLRPLLAEVDVAEHAATRNDWREVGIANMRFHQQLVGLAGSPRMSEVTARLFAELRLAIHIVGSPKEMQEPYIARNRLIVGLLSAGDTEGAVIELQHYLRDSEAQLLAAYRATRTPPGI